MRPFIVCLLLCACTGTHRMDAGADAGTDAGTDAGFDAGVDAGCQSWTPAPQDPCDDADCDPGEVCLGGRCVEDCGGLGELVLRNVGVGVVHCIEGDAYDPIVVAEPGDGRQVFRPVHGMWDAGLYFAFDVDGDGRFEGLVSVW